MSEGLSIIARTREDAHAAAKRAYEHAQALVADGKRVRITAGEDDDDLSIHQRGFLHKAVFPQIAEQYTFPDGARYAWQVWKEHFRARFLGDRWVLRAIPRWDPKQGRLVQPKRKTPHRERVSTEDLSMKQYSEYIDRVIDTATLELGVQFVFLAEEREAVRYVAPARKRKTQPEAETA